MIKNKRVLKSDQSGLGGKEDKKIGWERVLAGVNSSGVCGVSVMPIKSHWRV